MGAVTTSEGEMTASGLARGAFYGVGGGIVGGCWIFARRSFTMGRIR